MIQFKKKLTTSFSLVVLSVVFSVSTFLAISMVVEIADFYSMLIMSAVIPLVVSLPLSIVFNKYLKEIEEQKIELEKLDILNKKMFSLLSHDIRSPLANLKGTVSLLVSDTIDLEEGKKLLGALSIRIENVLSFLDDLLQWSKKQTDNKPVEYTSFKCKEIIKPSCDLLDGSKRTKNIQLDIGDLNSTIYTDKDIYAFVFRNVYHNAIKFTPEHGNIEIYTEIKSGEVYTTIRNTGSGIEEDDINKMLDETKWFTKVGTLGEVGTGLGISSCINYLKDNNGRLLIESEIGVGTTVTFVLPEKAH